MIWRTIILASLLTLPALGGLAAQEGGALNGGLAALNAGKYDSAVKQLSAAVNSDKSSPGEAAKALYLRGIAYRKMNQPSRAIADLGAAMWLGLPASDRIKAQVNRGLAYRAAGLTEQGDAEIAAAKKSDSNAVAALLAEDGGAGANTTAIAAFSTEVHAGDGTVAPPPRSEPTPGFNTTVTGGEAARPPAPPRTADAAPPTAAPPTAASSWSTSTSGEGAPAPEGGNRLSRWFDSVTDSSGESAPPPQPSAPPPQAATQPRVAAAPSAGWDAQTQIVTADARPSAGDGGSYQLQLAASRSEDEAKQLWQKVKAQNPGLAGKEPQIAKTDIGDLGTFYRLQIGPFQDKAESLKLCNALKRSGVDCFLVTR